MIYNELEENDDNYSKLNSDYLLKINAEKDNFDAVEKLLDMNLEYYLSQENLIEVLDNISSEMKLYIKNYLLIKRVKKSLI